MSVFKQNSIAASLMHWAIENTGQPGTSKRTLFAKSVYLTLRLRYPEGFEDAGSKPSPTAS